jgi:hypothetical protein
MGAGVKTNLSPLPQRVIFFRRDAPVPTVGLPSVAPS